MQPTLGFVVLQRDWELGRICWDRSFALKWWAAAGPGRARGAILRRVDKPFAIGVELHNPFTDFDNLSKQVVAGGQWYAEAR